MPHSKKGLLALMHDLMAHHPRHPERWAVDGKAPAPSMAHGWVTTSSFDLATTFADARSSIITPPRMPKVQRFGG
jgi:hypothetical protein